MDLKISPWLNKLPSWNTLKTWDWQHLPHRIYAWQKNKYAKTVNHQEVAEQVLEDGRMTSRYSFMVVMACAIAMIGLLLSSPAVIIGAMLISPLMGPIVSLGFSLCTLHERQMEKALEALGIGIVLAIGISFIIVKLSPITDPTPEILARTHPNLFDLLVAIFSGLAGGYAVIRNRGGAIVGVAIATALMPPLAVTGYGLAVSSFEITKGAFLLFMTNLLAIALTVSALAKWYGFGTKNSPSHTYWQVAGMIVIFAILSVPLGFSLKNIAYQAYAAKIIRSEIEEGFEGTQHKISNFSLAFRKGGQVEIDTIIVTDNYLPDIGLSIQKDIEDALGRPAVLNLDQIVVARRAQRDLEEKAAKVVAESALANPMQKKISLLGAQEEMTTEISNAIFFPTRYIKVDMDQRIAIVQASPAKGINITVLHDLEKKLRERYPEWSMFVIPPFASLPPVYFSIGKSTLSPEEAEKLNEIVWTLRRWEIDDVAVIGFASTIGDFERFNNTSLAYRRARSVVLALEEQGIKAEPRAEYASFKQKTTERDYGVNSFHKVEIRLNRAPEPIETSITPAPPEEPPAPAAEPEIKTEEAPQVEADPEITPEAAEAENPQNDENSEEEPSP